MSATHVTDATTSHETALRRGVVYPSWLGVAGVCMLGLLPGELPDIVVYAPFGFSVVILGLPHGAVDHLVPGRLGSGVTRRSILAVGGLYLVLMMGYATAWWLAPTAAFVAFVLLTWAHWGQGDVYAVLAFFDAEHLPTTPGRVLALVVRGGIPMVVPLIAFPERYRAVAGAAVSSFGASPTLLAPLFTEGARLTAGGCLLTATAAGVALGGWRVRRGAARRPWLLDVGETTLLWVLFLTVRPVLAVGAYFCLWHALRHVGRLLVVDPEARAALDAGDLATAGWEFTRDAAPLTAAAGTVFLALYLAVPSPPTSVLDALGLYLVGIAVLTLPHVVVVTWMDVRQGVWT